MGKCPFPAFNVCQITLNQADLFAQLPDRSRQVVLNGKVEKQECSLCNVFWCHFADNKFFPGRSIIILLVRLFSSSKPVCVKTVFCSSWTYHSSLSFTIAPSLAIWTVTLSFLEMVSISFTRCRSLSNV